MVSALDTDSPHAGDVHARLPEIVALSPSTTPLPLDAAMRRALQLAARGPAGGANPQVGCVLLAPDGHVIAEGWHRGAGTAHAEVDAVSRASAHELRGATAVVTLEPCNHTGLTGPCSLALIDAGVARVVFAESDPNAVAAGGADRLRAAGVQVEHGLLAAEAARLNERWTASVALGRPWVTAKWASSLDGRIAASDGTSQWITGPAARADVHARRADHGAILVGTGTALADDPALTARDDSGALLPNQPIPVIVGHRALPASAAAFAHPRPRIQDSGDDLPGLLERLRDTGIRSVFVEGGPTIVSAFATLGLIDEYVVYLAPTLLGGSRLATTDLGVSTIGDQRRLTILDVAMVGDDVRVIARPQPAEPALSDRNEL